MRQFIVDFCAIEHIYLIEIFGAKATDQKQNITACLLDIIVTEQLT